ncbi:DMT family transporter [Winogradskyella thalassocola]|uniref:EamA domain-containing membrane protein RarD n=1 Tax=Winogradskyella thalassocola TaxID=262004 RepID=A0A1G7W762_9FLAO|nr:DMT family transporter [Winogradskyella thalassocola]SDG67782.1 EamA domain-containing membrane protein RarD [Winogradskyella thalassocola]
MNSRKFAIFALIMVQVLYGLNFTIAKTVMNENFIKPFGFVLIRVAGATVLFWIMSLFLPKQKIDKKDYLKLFVAAIFGVMINMLFFFKGLEYTSPIHASAITITVPIIILILSAIILKENVSKLKIVGVTLGLIGALVLTIYGKSARAGDNVPLGNLLVFLNAISYSIYVIMIKKLTSKYHPFTFIKWLFLFGLIMLIPFGYNDLKAVEWHTFTPNAIWSVVFVVVGATFGTYLFNPLALNKLKASTVGIFIYLQPVIAGLFAISIGADFIDPIKIGAMLLIFLGVFLVSKKPKNAI